MIRNIKRVADKRGNVYTVDFFTVIRDGKITLSLETDWSCKIKTLAVHYRHERTWNDHMGNTPCGYYVNLPLPTGERKRMYVY